MSDEHTPTLQQIAADRDWWSAHAGKHYRDLAHWLRGIAAKCRLSNPQQELLDLARHFDIRANDLSRRSAAPCRCVCYSTCEGFTLKQIPFVETTRGG
jgi:hypothetical protein